MGRRMVAQENDRENFIFRSRISFFGDDLCIVDNNGKAFDELLATRRSHCGASGVEHNALYLHPIFPWNELNISQIHIFALVG